jgi:hypothetical protein
MWRVGTSDNINIYSDPWISASSDRKIISLRTNMAYSKVSQLIDVNTGLWDEPLIRNLFLPVDVNRILQIPLNIQGFEDFIASNCTEHGRFTVRSAYHLPWRFRFGPRAGQLSLPGSSVNNPVWNSLWKIQLSSKIKKIAWYCSS